MKHNLRPLELHEEKFKIFSHKDQLKKFNFGIKIQEDETREYAIIKMQARNTWLCQYFNDSNHSSFPLYLLINYPVVSVLER